MANALQTLFTEIADSIRGGLPNVGKMSPNDFPEKIDEIVANGGTGGGGGGGDSGGASVSSSDINFYDYDGTRVAAWTLEELAAATALPDNPSHDGLIAQGWNWSLADLKATNRIMDVGQMYVTDDGKTRLYISVEAKGRTTVPLYFSQTVANGVTIDWGDGSATQTLSGTGNVNAAHTYAETGDYVISLETTAGCALSLGSDTVSVLGASYSSGTTYTKNMLRKVEIGNGVESLGASDFSYCFKMDTVSIPNSVTSVGKFSNEYGALRCVVIPNGATNLVNRAFRAFKKVKIISIPNGVTSIGTVAFDGCESLESITLPDSVTSIGDEAPFRNCKAATRISLSKNLTQIPVFGFVYCESVGSITIPSGVTSIANQGLKDFLNLSEIHFKPTTPPKLGSSNSIENLPQDCKIYVPAGSLSAYTSASNYPDPSTYTYIEE